MHAMNENNTTSYQLWSYAISGSSWYFSMLIIIEIFKVDTPKLLYNLSPVLFGLSILLLIMLSASYFQKLNVLVTQRICLLILALSFSKHLIFAGYFNKGIVFNSSILPWSTLWIAIPLIAHRLFVSKENGKLIRLFFDIFPFFMVNLVILLLFAQKFFTLEFFYYLFLYMLIVIVLAKVIRFIPNIQLPFMLTTAIAWSLGLVNFILFMFLF